MKHHMLTLLCASVLAAGCAKQEAPPAESAASAPDAPTPQAFVDTAPAGEAVPIPEARTRFASGDAVVLDGRVMGVRKPFVEGRAVFVLGDDATITSCDEMDEDHCRSPWDACCDPAEIRAAGTATIQLVDADGAVLPQGLKGVNGLQELARVTVKGAVAPGATEQAFVVNADALYVHP